jgi:hypothetical protein
VTSASDTYKLCHQSNTWHTGTPHWRYFQFNDNSGSLSTFNGTFDVMPFINYLVSNWAVSKDLWLTRIEVGTEIDDNTAGSVSLKNVAFSINGTTKSPQFAP